MRGFGYWKHKQPLYSVDSKSRFSPREGIWLLETHSLTIFAAAATRFSPREGIWLLETLEKQLVHVKTFVLSFSPREGIWLLETSFGLPGDCDR